VARLAHEGDVDLAARRSELDGVEQEIPDDLLQAGAVAHDLERKREKAGGEADVFCGGGGADGVDRGGDDGDEVDAFDVKTDLAGGDAAHVEEVLDELGLNAGVALDDREAVGEFAGGVGALLENLSPAEDGVERGAQLVGERGEEFVLEAAGALGLGAGGAFAFEEAFAFRGGGVAFGDIAHDLGEADATALRVRERDHLPGNEETDTAFLDVPTIVAGASGGLGGGAFVLGNTFGAIFGSEQDVAGAAENFVGGVAEEALGAGVPVRDEAVVVEKEDGVVGQAVDDETVARFAFAEVGLDLLLPGDVERDAFEVGGLSRGGGEGASGSMDPTEGSLRSDDAEFDIVACALFDGALDRLADAGPILGMDVRVERSDVDGGAGREGELLFEAFVPRETPVGQLPGKRADFRGFGGEVELFAKLFEGLGGGAKFADIEEDAGEADGLAVGVVIEAPAGEDAARRFAADDAVFDLAAPAAGDGRFDALANAGGVVGMDAFEVGFEGGGGGLVGRDAKPVREAVVALDLVFGQFPDPGGDVTGEDRGLEAGARFLQGAALGVELEVRLFEVVGAAGEFLVGGGGAGAEDFVGRTLGAFGFLKAKERGDVLEAVKDVSDAAGGVENGDVGDAPVSGFGLWKKRVAEKREFLRLFGGEDGVKGVVERGEGKGRGEGGNLGEEIEERPTDEVFTRGGDEADIGVGGGGDRESGVGAQEQIRVGSGLENRLRFVHRRRRAARGVRRRPFVRDGQCRFRGAAERRGGVEARVVGGQPVESCEREWAQSWRW